MIFSAIDSLIKRINNDSVIFPPFRLGGGGTFGFGLLGGGGRFAGALSSSTSISISVHKVC